MALEKEETGNRTVYIDKNMNEGFGVKYKQDDGNLKIEINGKIMNMKKIE